MNKEYFDIIRTIESGDYSLAQEQITNWDLEDHLHKVLKMLLDAEILIYEGKFEESNILISQAIELNETLNDSVVGLIIAIHQITLGLQNTAGIETIQLIEKINSEYLEKVISSKNWEISYLERVISRFYHTVGNYYTSIGNLNLAVANYIEAIKLRRELEDTKGLASSLNKLSIVYKLKGELLKSRLLCHEAIELEEKFGNKQALAVAQYTLGQLERELGNYESSIEYLQKSLINLSDYSNPYLLGLLNFELFITILPNDKQLANKFFDALNTICETQPKLTSLISLHSMANAINLKNSSRIREKFKSQDMLRQLVDSPINFKIKLLVLKNLIELLIDELKITNEEEVLIELVSLIEKMKQIADTNNSHPILVDTLLLDSKFKLIMGDIKEADDNISEAIQIASTHNLTHRLEIAYNEKANFENTLKRFNELSTKGASIINRIAKTELQIYLAAIPSMIDLIESQTGKD